MVDIAKHAVIKTLQGISTNKIDKRKRSKRAGGNRGFVDHLSLSSNENKNELEYIMKISYQLDGVAMGSPLGPLMANSFMCSIEEQIHEQGLIQSCFRRYVDDKT